MLRLVYVSCGWIVLGALSHCLHLLWLAIYIVSIHLYPAPFMLCCLQIASQSKSQQVDMVWCVTRADRTRAAKWLNYPGSIYRLSCLNGLGKNHILAHPCQSYAGYYAAHCPLCRTLDNPQL